MGEQHPETRALDEALRDHATRLLETDDIRGIYGVLGRDSTWDCEASLWARPRVFRGRVDTLYWLLWPLWFPVWFLIMLGSSPGRFLWSRSLTSGAEQRARMAAASTTGTFQHFGGWQSIAGQLLLSLQPRARCAVNVNLVVTGTELAVVHLDASPRRRHRPESAVLGFRVPLSSVPWVRDISTRPRGRVKANYELGFCDGSWQAVMVLPVGDGNPDLRDVMPRVLDASDPIPAAAAPE
ncbi:hypothetical protein [Streptomyces sp. cg35]|uniref:hypothetical protein n=1 Tax=Streptomyces sp. cg35 TaxID=3421650 RepID=UPI003D182C13